MSNAISGPLDEGSDNIPLSTPPISPAQETEALQRELNFAAEIGQYLLEQNQELERALEDYRLEGEWLRRLLEQVDATQLSELENKIPRPKPASLDSQSRRSVDSSSLDKPNGTPSDSTLRLDKNERKAYAELYDRYVALKEEHANLGAEFNKRLSRLNDVESEAEILKRENQELRDENEGLKASLKMSQVRIDEVDTGNIPPSSAAAADSGSKLQDEESQPTTPSLSMTEQITPQPRPPSISSYKTLAASTNISTIVKLMVGCWLLKYNKRMTKMERRYVMVNPYTRTVSWCKNTPANQENEDLKTVGARGRFDGWAVKIIHSGKGVCRYSSKINPESGKV
ncbi:hypothetical protein HDV05_005275 [Chytridiales sp. JEL 0842]|nr:hypothetical protein HDV05_005275 [Chytridiales sp. JEL 0842]